jgi:hypothetical protein
MAVYRLTAVTAEGHGLTWTWGDTYEVEAESYAQAEAGVLGRAGADGETRYARIARAYVWGGPWAELTLAEDGSIGRESLALTVACPHPHCQAAVGQRCFSTRNTRSYLRARRAQRIKHPHATRIASAASGGV